MAGRVRRGPSSGHKSAGQADHEEALAGPGNEALQRSSLGGDHSVDRELALGKVEHASLVLQIPQLSDQRYARFTEIVSGSSLNEEQRDQLLGRLDESRVQGELVQAALDGADMAQAELWLQRAADDLVGLAPGGEHQSSGDLGGADQLVADALAKQGPDSTRILAFVQSVHLGVLLDEEEDELVEHEYEVELG